MSYVIESFAHHTCSVFDANWSGNDPWEERVTWSLKDTYSEAIDDVKQCFSGFRCVDYVQIYERDGEFKSLLRHFDRKDWKSALIL